MNGGTPDLSTPHGRMMAMTIVASAQREAQVEADLALTNSRQAAPAQREARLANTV